MARPKAAGSTKHLQIDIGQRSFERLQRLKERTEVSKYGDVISDALRLYEAIVEDVLSDREVLTRKKDGTDEIPYRLVI